MPPVRNLAACLRPWAEAPLAALAGLRGVLTDIDDTLTRDGRIEPASLVALQALAEAGRPVIAITGRPAGWSEAFALQWPVAAIVAENGAVMLRRAGAVAGFSVDGIAPPDGRELEGVRADNAGSPARAELEGFKADNTVSPVRPEVSKGGRAPRCHSASGVLGPCEVEIGAVLHAADDLALQRDFVDSASLRATNTLRLQACAAEVLAQVPGATLARDSAGRLTDIAIDHSEFTHLPPDRIAEVVAVMRRHALTATVSSIHINGWIGAHNKYSGAQWAIKQVLGLDFIADEWLYVGDSTNDQVMFEHLPMTVGVANIARFVHELAHAPAYVTRAERGQGFAEVAAAVLAARPGAFPRRAAAGQERRSNA